MKLGQTVGNIRSRKVYTEHREELEAIGFDFKPIRKRYSWDSVKSALQIYERLHGDLLVPCTFIVPEKYSAWSEELWGMKLGRTVGNIRSGLHTGHRNELETMGFVFSLQKKRGYSWDSIKSALQIYESLMAISLFLSPSLCLLVTTLGLRSCGT
jgi:hypothetical protein